MTEQSDGSAATISVDVGGPYAARNLRSESVTPAPGAWFVAYAGRPDLAEGGAALIVGLR